MEKGSVLPLIFGAGLAAAVMSGTKKKKKKKPKAGDACDVSEDAPKGLRCAGGVLEQVSADEDELEVDEDPSGEEAGDFEEREEDMSPSDDEDVFDGDGNPIDEDPVPVSASCDDFLKAVHVSTTDPSEYPIHSVAVSQTVIPVMDQALKDYAATRQKPIDVDEVGPLMVLESLEALVPVCQWTYDEVSDEFTFDGGREIDSSEGGEVLFGLMKLATEIVEQFNKGFNLTSTVDPKTPDITSEGSESPFQAAEAPFQAQAAESPFQATPNTQGN